MGASHQTTAINTASITTTTTILTKKHLEIWQMEGQGRRRNPDWNRPKDGQLKKPFTDDNRSNATRNDRGEQRCFRCGQKGHFKRDCMTENVHMYQEETMEENVNMRQEAKPIMPKAILKKPNLETIKEDEEEAEVNLRRGSNPYQYNVVDDFRWTPTNMFFGDLMKVGPYRESMQQYLAALERKEQRSVKAAQVEEKPVYRSYVRLGRNSIQASWDTGAQISVCTKPLAVKLGLKWTKPTEATNMVTVNGQKSPTLGIVENVQLKIMDALVPINIHVVDSTKEELLIGSN